MAESLRDVASLLSQNIGREQLLKQILAETERDLPCDIAAIWLTEENGQSTTNPISPKLRLAAVHGSQQELIEKVIDISSLTDTWLPGVLNSNTPVIRSTNDPQGPLGLAMGFTSEYSSIATPLRIGERRVGLLALAHRTPNRYGSEAQAMITAFASYAAVAIENAHLYTSAQEQAWVSTVLLQVAEATQSLTTIEELLSTVVRLPPLLVGVEGCVVYLWDEGSEQFELKVAYGVTPVIDLIKFRINSAQSKLPNPSDYFPFPDEPANYFREDIKSSPRRLIKVCSLAIAKGMQDTSISIPFSVQYLRSVQEQLYPIQKGD